MYHFLPWFGAMVLWLANPHGIAAKTAGGTVDSLSVQYTRARAAKDSLLRYDPNSPLPPQTRAAFAGLPYFPPEAQYRVLGELSVYGRRQQISVPTSNNGPPLPMEKFGRLQGQIQGKAFWLEVYRSLENGDLEIFFKDPTNGVQTYGGGRYVPVIDLVKGQYLVDFNMSYSPYCAYSSGYVCPLPPSQNHLSIPILAGEKAFGPELAH